MQFLQQLLQQCKDVWLGMSMTRRIGFVLVAVCCLAAIGGVGYWASQPDYRVLYSELAAEDAGAITAKLQAKGVSFRLAANGTTILVPAEQVHQARLDLTMDGLPSKGGKGFDDLMDNNILGMTPSMQHINYNRALQAELARTIMQIEPVAFARVHLVQPEPTPFFRDQKPTTASVVLKLKPAGTLTRNTAAGIAAVLARSVKGLSPEYVTLMDTNGRVLFDQRGENSAVPSSQLEYQKEYEAYLASKAEAMLTPMVGSGRAIVQVRADINFKSLTETKETYTQDQKAIKKETLQTSTSTGGASQIRPVAGAASNLSRPGSSGAGTPGTKESTENSDVEYYTPPKTVQQRVEAAGGIERLTVAVMVDREAAPATSLNEIQEITKKAVGFKMGRDEITASDVKLAGSPALAGIDAEILEGQRRQFYLSLARSGSLGVVALVGLGGLVLAWLVLRRRSAVVGGKEASEGGQTDQNGALDKLNTLAQRDPEALAELLASWLGENQAPRAKTAA